MGDGRAVLKYLAPYVRRGAISDHRIVACDESTVTFRYQPSNGKATRERERSKTRTVAGTEFVRGFVQHTLPPGFQKIRHYGWMSSNSKVSLDEVRWLIWLLLGWTYWLAGADAAQPQNVERPALRCAECGGALRVVAITFEPSDLEPCGLLSEHALAYLDSG